MRLTLSRVEDANEPSVLLLAVNDTTDTVRLDHRLLIGPNAAVAQPVQVEPSQPASADNVTVLAPGCCYGRIRSFPRLTGSVTFHGYLVSADEGGMLPQGPANDALLVAGAGPITLDL